MPDQATEARAFAEANGTLYVFDQDQLPFKAARLFFVRAPQGAVRGKHAHKVGHQFLTVVAGRVRVTMIEVSGARTSLELGIGQGVHLPPRVWATQEFIGSDSVLLVLCDLPYEEGDYVRDEDEFLLMT